MKKLYLLTVSLFLLFQVNSFSLQPGSSSVIMTICGVDLAETFVMNSCTHAVGLAGEKTGEYPVRKAFIKE